MRCPCCFLSSRPQSRRGAVREGCGPMYYYGGAGRFANGAMARAMYGHILSLDSATSDLRDGGMKLNGFLLKSTIVAALGGLLFGFDTAVISGATHALKLLFSLSDWELGVTVSSALLGTVIGAMTAGLPGEKYGRRDS